MQELREILACASQFEKEAHQILASHEASRSRVITLEGTYAKLRVLNLRQDELFRQAIRCTENALFKAAHVMAWAAFMDFFEDKLGSDQFAKLAAARPRWTIVSVEQLRETYTEYQIIEGARDSGLCGKTLQKSLHALLNKRNECAHPSDYTPGLNETLGYLSEVLARIKIIAAVPY